MISKFLLPKLASNLLPKLANLRLVLISLLFLGLSNSFILGLIRISGDSMFPTIKNGQVFLLNHLFSYKVKLGFADFKRGSIVVFKPPLEFGKHSFVKRVVAIPGDRISIIDNKILINNKTLSGFEKTIKETRSISFPKVLIKDTQIISLEGYSLAELPEYLRPTLAMLEPIPNNILKQSQSELISYTASIRLKASYYFVLGDNRTFAASEDSAIFGPIYISKIEGLVIN